MTAPPVSLVQLLRDLHKSTDSSINYELEDGSPVDSVQQAHQVRVPPSRVCLLQDPSGYKSYSVLQLVYLFECRDLDYAQYLSKSLALGTQLGKPMLNVSFADRKELLDYIQGLTDQLPGLASTAAEDEDSEKIADKDIKGKKDPDSLETGASLEYIDVARLTKQDRDFIKLLVLSRERGLRDSTSILLAKSGKGFEFIRSAFSQERMLKRKQRAADVVSGAKSSLEHKRHKVAGGAAAASADPRKTKAGAKPSSSVSKDPSKSSGAVKPIIIVPSAVSSLITLYNAKDLLMDQQFISSESYREKGAKRPTHVTLMRDPSRVGPGIPTSYEVIDSIDKLKPADWYSFCTNSFKKNISMENFLLLGIAL